MRVRKNADGEDRLAGADRQKMPGPPLATIEKYTGSHVHDDSPDIAQRIDQQ
jgi:hypothetical protein